MSGSLDRRIAKLETALGDSEVHEFLIYGPADQDTEAAIAEAGVAPGADDHVTFIRSHIAHEAVLVAYRQEGRAWRPGREWTARAA